MQESDRRFRQRFDMRVQVKIRNLDSPDLGEQQVKNIAQGLPNSISEVEGSLVARLKLGNLKETQEILKMQADHDKIEHSLHFFEVDAYGSSDI